LRPALALSALFAVLVAGFALTVRGAQNQVPPAPAPAPTHGVHTIAVRFDYDFRVTPACTSQVTKHCVQQFVVYDISSGATTRERYKLFSVPLPPSPTGMVHGISGAGAPRDFYSGQHLLGVTALGPATTANNESNPQTCATWITIP
jgi:hypothetical protein